MGFTSKRKQLAALLAEGDNFDQPVEVYGWARTKSSANWRRVLRFTDRDGADRMVAAASGQIRTGTRLLDFLEDHGFAIPPTEEARKTLVQVVLTAQPTLRVLLVERPGWHGSQFLFGTESLGVGAENLMTDGGLDVHRARVQQSGTLADWQAHIADPCAASSYLILALCLAFAAPLARLAQLESSCVNFWGASDEDARSVEAVGATVFGRGTGDGGYSRSWQETTAGMMQMADGHCDLPLGLSDLNGLGANSKIAAGKAADIAYSITDGSTLRRLARRDGQGAEAAHRAQVLVVSASTRRLSGSPRIHNTLRSQQAEARIIDIPIPNRSSGIFDRSLSRPDREGRKLAERLRNSSLAHYGTAGRGGHLLSGWCARLPKTRPSSKRALSGE
jgi:putative DNA primase/helicase